MYLSHEADAAPVYGHGTKLTTSGGVASTACDLIDLLASALTLSSSQVAAMKQIFGYTES